ncbi:hypothetical protein J7U46_10730 [Pelomonas sp. V22]|uniref:hypothetical protein n=1 Tax=Pelomonas sp. V22 TaxID=2822139 RepID=UPI0024A81F27|nr:hypothetical protein [Pelomonas sp. V22]MDI4633522.1 hypothetical protein [Pelomonas sp. V22]
MHVNLPLNKVEPTTAKPAPTAANAANAGNAGKAQPGSFSELLKNAQAAAPAPAAPL